MPVLRVCGAPRRMTARSSRAELNLGSVKVAFPSSKSVCASDPAVEAMPCLSANSCARRFILGKRQRALKVSIASTRGKISNKSASCQCPLRVKSKGCETLINALCSFRRAMVSCGERPAGISSVTYAANISPFVVMISSPTITNSDAIFCASSAPAIVL